MAKNVVMTEGNIRKTLINLTIPMIFGILGLSIFNLVDTFFVSLLGTEELAALSFTYPVVLTLNSISLGIGMGTVSVVSRAVGNKNRIMVKRYATDSLLLGIVVAFIFIIVGLSTIEPVFRLLGASDSVMPIIISYMRIWYIGTIFVVVPMIGNNTIRALGDVKTPSLVMMISALVNTILDPILIFGLGPFPRLEVPGAAIATVISRMITFSVALYILWKREKILSFKDASINKIINSWKDILYIGAPNALVRSIKPIGAGIITGLLANISMEAVAGFGIAIKIERFAFAIIMALATIMVPFIGQNFGARKFERIKKSVIEGYKIVTVSSIAVYLILFIFSNGIGRIFSNNVEVINVFKAYISIVSLFYGIYGIQLIGNSFFNAINQPIKAAMITITQMFIIFIPLVIILSNYYGVNGIFSAISISYAFAGGLAHFMVIKEMKKYV